MEGSNIELKFWTGEHYLKISDWYQDKDYATFFRCLQSFAYPHQFQNLPALLNQQVLEIHLKEPKKKEKFCGIATLYAHDPAAYSVYVGVVVDKAQWGRGIMTDALVTLLNWLFNKFNIRRVGIEFSFDDERMMNVFKRFGSIMDPKIENKTFEHNPFYEGKKKKVAYFNGKYHDIVMCSIFKNDYFEIMEKYYGR